jgi:hypothetical protein
MPQRANFLHLYIREAAEQLDSAFAFGWRSAGMPSTPGFGVMGGALQRCDNRHCLECGFSR